MWGTSGGVTKTALKYLFRFSVRTYVLVDVFQVQKKENTKFNFLNVFKLTN